DRVDEVGAPEVGARVAEDVVGHGEVIAPLQAAVRSGQIDRPDVPQPRHGVAGVDQVSEEPEAGCGDDSGEEDPQRPAAAPGAVSVAGVPASRGTIGPVSIAIATAVSESGATP